MHIVYLSLGSNLGNRHGNLNTAIGFMAASGITLLEASGVYETEPWGFTAEQPFLNQVIKASTPHPPEELSRLLQGIEHALGRRRSRKAVYVSRSMDIDILFYDDQVVQTEHLQIPHPRMAGRRFVLEPMASIAPQLVHPVFLKTVDVLLLECQDHCKVAKTEGLPVLLP